MVMDVRRRQLSQANRMGLAALSAVTGVMILGLTVAAVGEQTTACAAPDLTTTAAALADPGERVELEAVANGRWLEMARAPFGAAYAPAVWTGQHMLVVDPDTGRAAAYDPARDHWREAASAPRSFEYTAPSVWTGQELIIAELAGDGSRLGGLAYDPGRDRWREIATLPTEADEGDHALADAIWTGSHVVVVEGLGLVAAYDPKADCWVELGRVPGDPWAWHLYQVGPSLLIESRNRDKGVSIRSFDPANATWSPPNTAPLSVGVAENGASVIDGVLVYVSWAGDSAGGPAVIVFDPKTMAWSKFEHECATADVGTVVIDALLVSGDGRRALDPATLACSALAEPPRELNGTETRTWTGDELLVWSGLRSLPEPPRRAGLRYRPAPAEEAPSPSS
jgi:hypothetical protein